MASDGVEPGGTTVTVVAQVLKLPAASVAFSVTVLAPTGMVEPAAGDWVMTTAPPQASLAETPPVRSGTVPWQLPSAGTVVAGAQAVITGAAPSTMVRMVVQVAKLPESSEALKVKVTVPLGPVTTVPGGGS